MGLLTKTHFEARVDFYGIDFVGAINSLDATVHYDPPGTVATEEGNANALALLVPLTVSRLLWNARAQPEIIDPMMDLFREAADRLIAAGGSGAHTFRASELTDRYGAAAKLEHGQIDPTEGGLKAGLPDLKDDPPSRADQSFRTSLVENKRAEGYLWAKVKAPKRGPAFFAAFGTFALIEQIATREPYQEVTLPAMAATAGLASLFSAGLADPQVLSRQAGVACDFTLARIALSNDPLAQLDKELVEVGVPGGED